MVVVVVAVAFNDHKLIVTWSSQSSRGRCAWVNAAGLAAVGSPHYHGSKSQSRGQAEDQASIHCWIDRINLSGLAFAIRWGLLSCRAPSQKWVNDDEVKVVSVGSNRRCYRIDESIEVSAVVALVRSLPVAQQVEVNGSV